MNSTKDLRAFLVEKMTAVANDELELDKAKGISNLAQQIYNSLNIEIKMAIAKSKIDGKEIEEVHFGG